jgi:two-component system, cell cycle response regulator DivK
VATILIVEDNPDSLRLFRAVLAARGHAVIGLLGGEGLVDVVAREEPDVILLDIQLPGEDGFQLLQRLRASRRVLPPIAALTAHAMQGDRERALAAGFDGYLTKPIDVATFGVTVEGLLRG